MKIAIISLAVRIGDKTGDMVQAAKTANAMRNLGHDVLRVYLNPNSGEILDDDGKVNGKWNEVLADRDIVHSIPPIPWKFIRKMPVLKAKMVCSTVFWRSYTYTKVIQKTDGKLTAAMLKDYMRTCMAILGVPTYTSYYGYDLLLPNSEDEIKNVRRYCRIKRNMTIIAVPNAIDELPEYVNNVERSNDVPPDDYVLVPGVFASRKNQIAFIEAMKHTSYPIVFMGDGALLTRCMALASGNMRFIGHVEHGSKNFYGVMKYARVVCLPSNCETPGIAAIEAAALGARPVVPYEGGTCQYFGWDAEYIDPLSLDSIRTAIDHAGRRGRSTDEEASQYKKGTWKRCAQMTLNAYGRICNLAV